MSIWPHRLVASNQGEALSCRDVYINYVFFLFSGREIFIYEFLSLKHLGMTMLLCYIMELKIFRRARHVMIWWNLKDVSARSEFLRRSQKRAPSNCAPSNNFVKKNHFSKFSQLGLSWNLTLLYVRFLAVRVLCSSSCPFPLYQGSRKFNNILNNKAVIIKT